MWLPLAASVLGGLAAAETPGGTPKTTLAFSLAPTAMFIDTMLWVALPSLGTDEVAQKEWRYHVIPFYGASRGLAQTLAPECPAGLGSDCLGFRIMLFGYGGLSLGSQIFAAGIVATELDLPDHPPELGPSARDAAALLAGGVVMDALWWASLPREPLGGGLGWHFAPIAGPIAGLSRAGALDCAGDAGCSSLRAATISVSSLSGALQLGAVAAAIRGVARGDEQVWVSPAPVGEGYGLTLLGRW